MLGGSAAWAGWEGLSVHVLATGLGGAHQMHHARRSGTGDRHGASTSSVVPILPTASRKVVDHQSKPRVALTCWFTTVTSIQ